MLVEGVSEGMDGKVKGGQRNTDVSHQFVELKCSFVAFIIFFCFFKPTVSLFHTAAWKRAKRYKTGGC